MPSLFDLPHMDFIPPPSIHHGLDSLPVQAQYCYSPLDLLFGVAVFLSTLGLYFICIYLLLFIRSKYLSNNFWG